MILHGFVFTNGLHVQVRRHRVVPGLLYCRYEVHCCGLIEAFTSYDAAFDWAMLLGAL